MLAVLSADLPILSTQAFAQAGLLFLIPVFTPSVLGFDALQTGSTQIDNALLGGFTTADRAAMDDEIAAAPARVQEEIR